MVPESEKLLVGGVCLAVISRQRVCSAELQVRHGAYGIGQNDAAVIQDFLKFSLGLFTTTCPRYASPRIYAG
jgi:hypothetical protein